MQFCERTLQKMSKYIPLAKLQYLGEIKRNGLRHKWFMKMLLSQGRIVIYLLLLHLFTKGATPKGEASISIQELQAKVRHIFSQFNDQSSNI